VEPSYIHEASAINFLKSSLWRSAKFLEDEIDVRVQSDSICFVVLVLNYFHFDLCLHGFGF
jgi:hypothetical protein